METKPTSFNVAVQRHLSVDLENNRAFELVQCHTFLDFYGVPFVTSITLPTWPERAI